MMFPKDEFSVMLFVSQKKHMLWSIYDFLLSVNKANSIVIIVKTEAKRLRLKNRHSNYLLPTSLLRLEPVIESDIPLCY